jgi:CAAX protease family protein
MPSVPPPGTIEHDRDTPPLPPPPERQVDEPPWPVWTAPAAVVMGLVMGIFGSVIVDVAARAGGSSVSHPTPAVSLISDVVFDLAFVGAAIYFAAMRARPRLADFGFRRVRPGLAVGGFLAAGVGYYVLTAIYASLVKLHGSDKLPSELGVGKSTAALAGAAIFVCVIAPMAEEFFFRGFIFSALRRMRVVILGRDLGIWVAAVLTGILFGLAHTGSASSQYLIPLGFLGFVLCILRWQTRSLYPCMALHSVNNSLALGINQLNWNVAEILALIAGSLLVIGAATWPLGARTPAMA